MSRRPVVALATDFGSRDSYAAAMKLVIASRCDADIIDLTHEIAPGSLLEAAWFLRSLAPYRRNEVLSVIVCVVDPGVGTSRRLLAANREGMWWLAPDNGVLSLVVDGSSEIRSIENEELFLPAGSSTFHGRDRFAPAAAFLASGGEGRLLGPALALDELTKLDYESPSYSGDVIRGSVVSIDRFGNVVTDIDADKVRDIASAEMVVGKRRITQSAFNYESGSASEPFMIVGSQRTIEVSIRQKSAADFLQILRGDRIKLCLSTK